MHTLTPHPCSVHSVCANVCTATLHLFIHELESDLTNQRWILSSGLFLLSGNVVYWWVWSD